MRMRNTDESRARDLYLYTELDILSNAQACLKLAR
jgi:hypothetical protein